MISLWGKLHLTSRLILSTGLIVLLFSGIRSYVTVSTQASFERQRLTDDFKLDLESTVTAITEHAVTGDYSTIQQVLDILAHHEHIQRALWTDRSGKVLEAKKQPPEKIAPAWFLGWINIPDTEGSTLIEIGERNYGKVLLTYTSAPSVNMIWQQFLMQVEIVISGFLTFLVATIFILRYGLRPLRTLASSAERLGKGDFTIRIPDAGLPELSPAICAFNDMAEKLQTSIRSLEQSETSLIDAASEWRRTFDSIPDLISVLDKDFKIVRANKAFSDFFGQPYSALIGKKCYEVIHGGNEPIEDCPHVRAIRERATIVQELSHNPQNVFWMITNSPSFDAQGNLMGTVHVMKDITSRKEAELKIELQYEMLSALFTGAQKLAHEINIADVATTIVKSCVDIFGAKLARLCQVNADGSITALSCYPKAPQYFEDMEERWDETPLGMGPTGRSIRTKFPVVVNDIFADSQLTPWIETMTGENIHSVAGFPLIIRGESFGAITLYSDQDGFFTPERASFFQSYAHEAAAAFQNARLYENLQQTLAKLALAYDETILGWAQALGLRDSGTETHSKLAADMTVQLARALGIEKKELTNIYRGALLHDIGKIGIPDGILLKSDSLNDEEWKIMKKHPLYAQQILSQIAYLSDALDIPYCHHEKWDGSGYPQGLKGEEIPLAARIFAVVDVSDALRSNRSYRSAWSTEKVLEYLKQQSGKAFDPKVVEAFIELHQG